jgi:hypothetical protein
MEPDQVQPRPRHPQPLTIVGVLRGVAISRRCNDFEDELQRRKPCLQIDSLFDGQTAWEA